MKLNLVIIYCLAASSSQTFRPVKVEWFAKERLECRDARCYDANILLEPRSMSIYAVNGWGHCLHHPPQKGQFVIWEMYERLCLARGPVNETHQVFPSEDGLNLVCVLGHRCQNCIARMR
jgi:hypothetical protein